MRKLKPTLLPITSPSLVYYIIDAIISLVFAWLLPSGINSAAKIFGLSFKIPEDAVTWTISFFATFLFLYGLQITRWARDTIRDIAINIPSQVHNETLGAVDSAIANSIAGILLSSASHNPNLAHQQLDLVCAHLNRLSNLEGNLFPIYHHLSLKYMDMIHHDLDALQHSGLELDLEDQMYLVKSFADQSRDYLLIDPTIYVNVHDDWTPAWRNVMNWMRTQNHLKKTYIITHTASPLSSAEEAQLRSLSSYLKHHAFKVFLCSQIDLKDVYPDNPFLNRLFHVFDNCFIIEMTSQVSFRGAKKVLTRIVKADSLLKKHISNVLQYKTPYGG